MNARASFIEPADRLREYRPRGCAVTAYAGGVRLAFDSLGAAFTFDPADARRIAGSLADAAQVAADASRPPLVVPDSAAPASSGSRA